MGYLIAAANKRKSLGGLALRRRRQSEAFGSKRESAPLKYRSFMRIYGNIIYVINNLKCSAQAAQMYDVIKLPNSKTCKQILKANLIIKS